MFTTSVLVWRLLLILFVGFANVDNEHFELAFLGVPYEVSEPEKQAVESLLVLEPGPMVLVPQVGVLHGDEQLLVSLLDNAAFLQVELEVALGKLEQEETNEADKEVLVVDLVAPAHGRPRMLEVCQDLRL